MDVHEIVYFLLPYLILGMMVSFLLGVNPQMLALIKGPQYFVLAHTIAFSITITGVTHVPSEFEVPRDVRVIIGEGRVKIPLGETIVSAPLPVSIRHRELRGGKYKVEYNSEIIIR